MFAKRRRNYTVFVYTALIVMICILIVAILWPKSSEDNQNSDLTTTTQVQEQHKDQNLVNNEHEPDDYSEETGTEQLVKSYYIVRKEGEFISVFFVNANGQEVKLEDTGIVYDVLTLEDQDKFDKGIMVENQEKLTSLLQDFEG